jgi:hypothetical protein
MNIERCSHQLTPLKKNTYLRYVLHKNPHLFTKSKEISSKVGTGVLARDGMECENSRMERPIRLVDVDPIAHDPKKGCFVCVSSPAIDCYRDLPWHFLEVTE